VLAYDDVMNTQRLAIYARRRSALLDADKEVEETVRGLISAIPGAAHAFEEKQRELGDTFVPLLRRLLLQIIDLFWLEHLETMDYLRRSVSLRAYGQRDPLIEYRREGLARFRQLEEHIRTTLAEGVAHIQSADEARIRAEEERVRAALVAAGEKESGASVPARKGPSYGRNDLVTLSRGGETKTLKFKKAEPLLQEGWKIQGGH
jgi:preprotein translocase subunit SecA